MKGVADIVFNIGKRSEFSFMWGSIHCPKQDEVATAWWAPGEIVKCRYHIGETRQSPGN